jgi:hypothetical protein
MSVTPDSYDYEKMFSKIEKELEEAKKAMEQEYEANKESPLYQELHRRFCELEEEYETYTPAPNSHDYEDMLSVIEEKLDELKKSLKQEYEVNKESVLYQELHRWFCELEAEHAALKKEKETYEWFDDYNHRRKMCIYCGGYEYGEDCCPSRKYGATGPCPLAPASIANKN